MKIGSREYKEWLDSPLTKALKSSFEQSVTDPENQPSQYGTVTLAMYELVCKQRDLAVEAASDAATSLETIQLRSFGEVSYLDNRPQMRAFAGARAKIARDIISTIKGSEAMAQGEKP